MKKILFTTLIMLAFANIGWCSNVDVRINIPKLIQINNIGTGLYQTGDLTVSDVTTNGKSLDTTLCVSSNLHQDEGYHVTATDNGGSDSAFRLKNTETGHTSETLAYSVKFNDEATTSGNTELTYGQASTAGTFVSDGLGFRDDCSNANVQVVFTAANLRNARHGTYSGVLTLVVAPD